MNQPEIPPEGPRLVCQDRRMNPQVVLKNLQIACPVVSARAQLSEYPLTDGNVPPPPDSGEQCLQTSVKMGSDHLNGEKIAWEPPRPPYVA